VLHVRATDVLVAITPSWVPWPRDVVLATGVLELAFEAALLVPRWRKATGLAIALYVLAVWPANFNTPSSTSWRRRCPTTGGITRRGSRCSR
jgi:uncharacterized membrane protein